MMARGASSEGGSAVQTPAHDGERTGKGEGDGDAEMRDTQQETQGGDVVMTADGAAADADADAEHRRSDHERQEARDTLPPLPSTHALYKLPTQRKYPAETRCLWTCALNPSPL